MGEIIYIPLGTSCSQILGMDGTGKYMLRREQKMRKKLSHSIHSFSFHFIPGFKICQLIQCNAMTYMCTILYHGEGWQKQMVHSQNTGFSGALFLHNWGTCNYECAN